jgi:hypothetical protein
MITVYYAVKKISSSVDRAIDPSSLINMLVDSLVPVYNDLKKIENKEIDSIGSMYSCRSFLQYTKNMYLMKNPFNINVRIEKSKIFNFGDRSLDNLYLNRVMQTTNGHNLNYEPGYIFFSETPLEIEVLSPFMHKSNFCKNGYIVPGSYDISKWFRPVNPALQLYDNSDKEVQSDKGDPLMYINFKTNENVRLKRFNITQEIENIMYATTAYKKYDSNRSLSYLYDKFIQSGLNKKTLRLIKENLI